MQKNQTEFTFVSLFAGCGGSSLGHKMAGGRCFLAVEWDKNAVECYRLNFPGTTICAGDITELSDSSALQMAGLEQGELDLLDGSSPCQGFSSAGKMEMSDPRNGLFSQYARMLRAFMPKVFVAENVPGLVRGKMKILFAAILRELKGCGYNVEARMLDASRYGVPQKRLRLIFVGTRNDLEAKSVFPVGKEKPVSFGKALGIVDAEWMRGWHKGRRIALGSVAPTVTTNGLSGTDKRALLLTDKYGKLWDMIRVGGNASDVVGKGYNSCVKPDLRRPSPTLPKTQGGHEFATIMHPVERRTLTIEEAKILQSFPPGFRLVGSYSQQWARIGDSVPPLMMKAISETIRDEIFGRIGN